MPRSAGGVVSCDGEGKLALWAKARQAQASFYGSAGGQNDGFHPESGRPSSQNRRSIRYVPRSHQTESLDSPDHE